jgi:hypothetical protein
MKTRVDGELLCGDPGFHLGRTTNGKDLEKWLEKCGHPELECI